MRDSLAREIQCGALVVNVQCENGYIAQPMPTPTNRKRNRVHRMYFRRSIGRRRPRNPKATEITKAKITKACEWVSFSASIATRNPLSLAAVMLYDLSRPQKREAPPAN